MRLRERRGTRTPIAWLAVALSCTLASSAQAFSDPLAYGDPADVGGGGGRFFTGSTADGYACNACHEGGTPAEIQVGGLPLNGYSPGSSYEVTITWPPTIEHVSLVAEVTTREGEVAGTVRLPRFDAMQEGERCSLEEGGFPASQLLTPDSGRQLVSIVDCGARFLRFLWTAPAIPVDGVRFNLGFVSADNDGDAIGDGVTLVEQPLPAGFGEPEEKTVVEGCSTSPAKGGHSWAPIGLIAVGLGVRARARNRRWKR